MPRVSFIMASFNHEPFVADAIRSLLGQTRQDLEVIVVDDGSSDATADILEELATHDNRLNVHRRGNRGVVAARNEAVSLSSGEFLCVVDSDDISEPDRIERSLRRFEEMPSLAMVYGDSWIVDRSGERRGRFHDVHPVVEGDTATELFRRYCFVPASTVMVRRSALEVTGPFWGSGPTTDYIKWIEIGLIGPIGRIDHAPLASWRQHGGNVSGQLGRGRADQYRRLGDDLAALYDKHRSLRERVTESERNKRIAGCLTRAGYYALIAGEWEEARTHLRGARSLSPSVKATGLVIGATFPFCVVLQAAARTYESKRSSTQHPVED